MVGGMLPWVLNRVHEDRARQFLRLLAPDIRDIVYGGRQQMNFVPFAKVSEHG
ncbi:hypothetical protein PGT21_009807 [Puccinia graminis f. sp. tritici]|uniref:Uncharacterized protein n=1 Tax=Puccinia graminis f. sp. tritici TaxID=56615 RepID=A0A5B0SFR2_PUCGR|nr:hypothetical protein PGT21_009807 [Puccinia graminis f. sp. tritici]KAA1132365.1 hypothetical protein PGTUg99_009818 [Puccinia graminis f. sp. tritici]KAA1136848.1 hypothetical protein PGTUg99_001043 [Puccinia graminis f. sp. tritici]